MPIFSQPRVQADLISSRKRGILFKGIILPTCALILCAFIVNYGYVRAGMLKPDFAIIHEAYDFNFQLLPLMSAVLAILFCLPAIFKQTRYMWAVAWFLFISLDLLALRYYVSHVEPEKLVLKEVEILTPKLSQPIRILHVSDIQAGAVTAYETEIFSKIKSLDPDIIINTGDYLQVVPPANFKTEFPKLLKLIKSVNPRYGTYGVFGDTDLDLYRLSLEDLAPLKLLSSRAEVIQTEGGAISLYGLSLYKSKNGEWAQRGIKDWLNQTPAKAFRIVMGHAPDYALILKDALVDLCLAGHTHGGQIRIPLIGPLVIDSTVPNEWSSGMHRIGIPLLNVSAGAGSNRFRGLPRMRFNCPTEMTLITLIPDKRLH